MLLLDVNNIDTSWPACAIAQKTHRCRTTMLVEHSVLRLLKTSKKQSRVAHYVESKMSNFTASGQDHMWEDSMNGPIMCWPAATGSK